MKTSVSQYYSRNFAQEYDNFNHDTPDINYMLSGLSDRTYAMQYSFISNNPNPLGKKDILIDVANNSDYQQVHIRHHPFRTFYKHSVTTIYLSLMLKAILFTVCLKNWTLQPISILVPMPALA